jgi:hypothetical protein
MRHFQPTEGANRVSTYRISSETNDENKRIQNAAQNRPLGALGSR